jgi:phenylacetate-CoA ligase
MVPRLSVNSAIKGIAWPGIPAPSGASLLAILFQLDQSQWWSPSEVSRRQYDQLKVLLDHARTHVPFYRERLQHMADLPADETWPEVWRRIAPLTRAEIQAADAAETMITDALPPGHGELREIYTSGSTGKPIRSVRTQLWELIWSAFTVRDPSLAPARSSRNLRYVARERSGQGSLS